MKNLIVCFTFFFMLLFVACDFCMRPDTAITEPSISPLDSGVVYYQDKTVFDTLFYLDGEIAEENLLTRDIYDLFMATNSMTWPKAGNFQNIPRYYLNDNEFVYIKDSIITRITNAADTITEKSIYTLPMNPYLGTQTVNAVKKRMAFAYLFHDIIHVIDLETGNIKTVIFQSKPYTPFKRRVDEIDPNATYYVDAFAGKDYFYVLYWGHTREELVKQINRNWTWSSRDRKSVKTDNYRQDLVNIIEQFDWNGNPVCRYYLKGDPRDESAKFIVDEENKQFYLLSSEPYAAVFMCILKSNITLMVYNYDKQEVGQ